MSFWHALQYTYVLTALWQLASKENTQNKLNSEEEFFLFFYVLCTVISKSRVNLQS